MQQWEGAVDAYLVLSHRRNDAYAHNSLGRALAAAAAASDTVDSRVAAAAVMAAFEAALEREPCYAHALYNLGQQYEKLALAGASISGGDEASKAKALELYRRAVQCHPTNFAAQEAAGALLHASGRSGEAVTFFVAAQQLRPTRVQTLSNLGGVMIKAGRAAEAIGFLEVAQTLAPGHAHVTQNLAAARQLLL